MLLIYPMWDHEYQRIGKQKCTPLGYKLHGISEMIGFIGIILLVIVCAYLVYRRSVSTFQSLQLLLITVPVCLGIIGEDFVPIFLEVAAKKSFRYDYVTCEASWIEDGQRQVYKWKPNQNMDITR